MVGQQDGIAGRKAGVQREGVFKTDTQSDHRHASHELLPEGPIFGRKGYPTQPSQIESTHNASVPELELWNLGLGRQFV